MIEGCLFTLDVIPIFDPNCINNRYIGPLGTAVNLTGSTFVNHFSNYTFPSTNGTCEGVQNPFRISLPNIISIGSNNTFLTSWWNITCNNGALGSGKIFLADPNKALCVLNEQVYTSNITDLSCNTNYVSTNLKVVDSLR